MSFQFHKSILLLTTFVLLTQINESAEARRRHKPRPPPEAVESDDSVNEKPESAKAPPEKIQVKASEKITPEKLEEFKKVITAYEQKNYVVAEAGLQEWLKQKDLTEYANYYYAKLLQETARPQDAKKYYEKILDLSPNVKMGQDAQLQIALIDMEQKNYRSARPMLVKLEKKQRRLEDYPEIIYQLARAEKSLGNSRGSCNWIRKLYVNYPQFSKVANWSLNLAKDDFEGSNTGCSSNFEDQRKRIKNLQWAGLSGKAQAEIESLKTNLGLKEYGENYDIDRLEVGYLLHEGEVTKAVEILLKHYDKKKNEFGYLIQLASASARAGDAPAAVGSYYSAYRLAPKSKKAKEALYQSAFLSYQFQDYDGASRKFKEFMKVYSSSGLVRDANWHLAWIRYLKGDFGGAYKNFTELQEKYRGRKKREAKGFPIDRVTYWRAMSLYRQGDLAQAKPYFEKLSRDPLLGYYSIASHYRLTKLDAIPAKVLAKRGVGPKPTLRDQTRQISRYSVTETLYPMDNFSPSDEVDSEETIALTPLTESVDGEVTGGEEAAVADDSDDPSVEGPSAEIAESTEDEARTNLSNPVLVKRFERARDLMILGLNEWAKWDLYDVERKSSNRDYIKTLISEYETVESYYRSSTLAQNYFSRQRAQYGITGVRYLWEQTFPKAYAPFVQKYASKFKIPQELIWGIMRAESNYRREAMSPVGALGLMQVMPNTGAKISQLMSEKDFDPKKLLEPEVAIRIGARYLERLMDSFDQNLALTAAGYNAGPHRVKNWLSSFGNLELDEFVEHIPFLETRNYVKRVMTNAHVYSELYGSKKNIMSNITEPLKFKIGEPVPTKETWEDI